VVVSAIGIAQVLAWGSSYYLPAVLAKPIAEDTGWPFGWVVGALSIGLFLSGLISPRIGHLIEHHGGRPVLAISAVLLAIGLVILAWAPTLPVFIAGWLVMGVGMGAGLYDPAFSTLGRLYGDQARSAITYVTLYGGFASTVCWPFSAFLVDQFGWRGACLTYAGIHVLITLPLYLAGLPREEKRPPAVHAPGAPRAGRLRSEHRVPFALLAFGLTIASVTMTMMGVHLITIVQAQGVSLATAVGFGTLMGPSQVGARVLEAAFGRKHHPVVIMIIASAVVALGLGMLLGGAAVIAAGIILYGAGNGIRSIVRGTVPLALFGKEGYAIIMGWLSLPILVTQAISPVLGSTLLEHFGADGVIAFMLGLAILNVLVAAALLPYARRPRP